MAHAAAESSNDRWDIAPADLPVATFVNTAVVCVCVCVWRFFARAARSVITTGRRVWASGHVVPHRA